MAPTKGKKPRKPAANSKRKYVKGKKTKTPMKPKKGAVEKAMEKKISKTFNRAVLKEGKVGGEGKALSTEDVTLQNKMAKKGVGRKGVLPENNISLTPKTQKSFKRTNEKLKKSIGKKSDSDDDGPGIICLTNLPHGFFEKQLMGFFTQFGDVNHVRHVRSPETGRSCGYAFVEFRHRVVAKIVVSTMNNYLTYGKIIKCRFIKYTVGLSQRLFSQQFTSKNYPKVRTRAKAIRELNSLRDDKQIEKHTRRAVETFSKKMKKLESLGVKMDLSLDIGDRKVVKPKRNRKRKPKGQTKESSNADSSTDDSCVFEADESDDEIVIKTPPFAKKKLVKITPSSPAVRVTGMQMRSHKEALEQAISDTLMNDTPKSGKENTSDVAKVEGTKKASKKRKSLVNDSAVTPKRNKTKAV